MSAEQLEALRLAHQSVALRVSGLTLSDFTTAASSWEVVPVKAQGRLCGAILVKGSEIHACVLPWARGRWFGRAEAALLNRVIDQHGEATTSATTEDGRRFVERLGFINDNELYRRSTKWALNRSSR